MPRQPVRRDLAEEQKSLASTLTRPEDGGAYVGSPGASVPDMSDAQKQLVQESINMRTYGTGNPEFTTPQGDQAGTNQAQTNQGTGDISYLRDDGTTGTGDVVSTTDTSSMSVDDLMAQISAAREPTETISYEDQLAREMDAVQAQLDAINKIYDYRVSEAEREGQVRLGQTRSLGSISGTRFSPIGQAQQFETERFNKEQITAINQERAQELANIYAAARGEATRKVERLEDQAREDADAMVNDLVMGYNLSSAKATEARDGAYQIAMLTGMYGGEPTMAMQQFMQDYELSLGDQARQDEYLALAQEEAQRAGYDTITVGDKLGYIDYTSGAPQFKELADFSSQSVNPLSYIPNEAGFTAADKAIYEEVNEGKPVWNPNQINADGTMGGYYLEFTSVSDLSDSKREGYSRYERAINNGTADVPTMDEISTGSGAVQGPRIEEATAPTAPSVTEPRSQLDLSAGGLGSNSGGLDFSGLGNVSLDPNGTIGTGNVDVPTRTQDSSPNTYYPFADNTNYFSR